MITNTDNVVNTETPSISRHFPDYERKCNSNTNANFQQSGALAVPHADVFTHKFTKKNDRPVLDHNYRDRLVDFFASIGCQFVQLNGKRPIVSGWQHKPLNARQAKNLHGNAGVHAGKHSNGVIWIDLDTKAGEFFGQFPNLRNSLVVWRDNDLSRAKVAIRITDQLPRSTTWRANADQKAPDVELLSTGRQAAVIGIHDSGVVIKNNGKAPLEMTFADVSAIWRKWTREELPHPTRTADTTKTATAHQQRAAQRATRQAESNPHAAAIKEHWNCLSVFAHFGLVNEQRTEKDGKIRLLANGGLLVDPVADTWRQYSTGAGGDVIAAWAWCKSGQHEVSGAGFMGIVNEMRQAAGLAPVVHKSSGVDWQGLIDHYSQPEAFERGRRNAYDRSVMCALLAVMKGADSPVVKMSVRQAGEDAGMSYRTAWKTLRRLIEAGYIAVVDGQSWFDRDLDLEDDEHLRNQFDALTYELVNPWLMGSNQSRQTEVPQLSEVTTVRSTSSLGLSPVVNSDSCVGAPMRDLDLAVDVITAYLDHDAFQYGAKVMDTACKLGRAALDVLAALECCNDLSSAELAEATGRGRSTCSEKANNLALLGLVEVYREGRTNFYYLVDNWRDILDKYIAALTTMGRTCKRKIRHLQERLQRAGWAINSAESGYLRMRLAQLIERWQRRLVALTEQLRGLYALRGQTLFA